MPSNSARSRKSPIGRSFARTAALVTVTLSLSVVPAWSQFVSGSNGSDGAYNPTTSGFFVPGNFKGSGVANNVFNFTTITIPAGVTITFSAWYDNAPVYWLATGNVDIEGTLNLAASPGANGTGDPSDYRIPPAAGSGGYTGGVGGSSSSSQLPLPGSGPGGGGTGTCAAATYGGAGIFTGNQYLVPLVGGSGGGGVASGIPTYYGPGGGAGGGAILIASSGTITVNGTISANGASGGDSEPGTWGCDNYYGFAGPGSGGAIHLVASTISGSGTINAAAVTTQGVVFGVPGIARLEAYTLSFTGSFAGTPESQSVPFSNRVFAQTIPSVPPASLQVTSINGVPVTENPFGFPDTIINSDQPVPVVIMGHEVPIGTVPTLTVLGASADQDNLQCPGGLQGTLTTSTCTMNVTFGYGASRGLYVGIWQNPGSD